MTAQLQIAFLDQPPAGLADLESVRRSVSSAFYEWVRHFDATAGTYTVNVTFQTRTVPNGAPSDTAIYGDTYLAVGNNPLHFNLNIASAFGVDIAGRSGVSPVVPPLTLYINPASFGNTGGNIVPLLERQFGHALGIRSARGLTPTQPVPTSVETTYDINVAGEEPGRFGPSSGPLTFYGPNAEAAYGGPVLLSGADASNPVNPNGSLIDPTQPGTNALTPLQVALLRDAGAPALTDQELQEHAIARLYFGALGRVADSAGLVLQAAAYQTAPSGLATVGDRLVGSAEFQARYGSLSDADFVRTVFRNVYGRGASDTDLASGLQALQPGAAGLTRGGLLSVYTQSDEARGRLSANANVTYSGTAEAQAARIYDTAFGRDADPGGFVVVTRAIINGATLGQLAQGFLGSAEFANRYGAAPSDAALVTGLYRNTLGRAPEAAGQALYTNALAAGLSRADLVVAFSESPEHTRLLIAKDTQPPVSGFYSLATTPHLGIIATLTGTLYVAPNYP